MRPKKIFVALTLAALAIADAGWAKAQPALSPGLRVRLETPDPVVSLAFSPDGKTLIEEDPGYTIRHWDLSRAKELGRYSGDDWWSADRPEEFSILHMMDNHNVLHTAGNGLAVLDLKTGKQRVVTELARGKSSWISPDGKHIVTYTKHGSWSKRTATATFTLWDLQRSAKVREFTHSFKDAPAKADAGAKLAAVTFAPDGKTLATSWIYLGIGPMVTYRVGQLVCLWDVDSGKQSTLHAEPASRLHFLDGGKKLACADGRGAGGARSTNDMRHGMLEIWDVAAGKRLHRFESSVDWSGPLAFSPDGKLFASSGGDEDQAAVCVWRTDTGEPLTRFAANGLKGQFLADGHTVQCLAFSPDGQLLASGNLYEILVWDIATLR